MTLAHPRTTTKRYDLAVYIGRFQPFHLGHLSVVKQALQDAERVLILVGSANVARDTRNPFTYDERADLITDIMHGVMELDWKGRVVIQPLDDTPYDKPAWINAVNTAARTASKALRPRICLTGNIRDATSEYLTWFSAWDYLPATDTSHNATALRTAFFAGGCNFDELGWTDSGITWRETAPPQTIEFLRRFRDKPVYAYLMKQRASEIAYKAQWGSGPFQTVDPVIIKGDHVLMIERGGPEGTGMTGLPGGFLNAGERTLSAACREAVEETALFIQDNDIPAFNQWLKACKQALRAKEPEPVMPPCVQAAIALLLTYQRGRGERFDDPHRSRRGHLITEAFLFKLPDGHGLPAVVGSDDAQRAFWMPISEVRPDTTFEDHAFIIDKMLNLYA
jgi:bifunctional NMN adenylyltransferase/nudix hydrolase